MVVTILPEYNKQNKILIVNCYRTRALGIISVRLTELEFTDMQFLSTKQSRTVLNKETTKMQIDTL